MEQLPFEKYDNIFVLDGLFSSGLARWAAPRLNKGANCIIIDEENPEQIPGFFSRDELLGVHKAMKSALLAKAGPRMRGDWGWLESAHGIAPWRMEISARIFMELGLMRELDGPPWLGPAGAGARADLGSSLLYRRLAGG
jgi:hypothetical protein